jgi:hypothetical protein
MLDGMTLCRQSFFPRRELLHLDACDLLEPMRTITMLCETLKRTQRNTDIEQSIVFIEVTIEVSRHCGLSTVQVDRFGLVHRLLL